MLTVERLREILHYDPLTGAWTWLKPPPGRMKVGMAAGRKGGTGHWAIGTGGTRYPSARLAWFYMTGEWPSLRIDHKDRDPDNGRWENLREATPSQNGANHGMRRNNTSGHKGVCWSAKDRRWVAQITVNRKHLALGLYSEKGAAAAAYKAAAQQYFGDFAGT